MTVVKIGRIASAFGVSAFVCSLAVMPFGIFGLFRNLLPDSVLDASDVVQRLNEGIEEVVDADRRSGDMRHYPLLDNMTAEDLELARRMADALSNNKD